MQSPLYEISSTMTINTVLPFLRRIPINSAILIKKRLLSRHSVLHCFPYSLLDSISTYPVTQCVYSPSLRDCTIRTHTYPRYMLVKTARDTLTHKEEGSQRLTTSSLRSNESRCRLRKSRKEFDVLVDGGSPITVDGSALLAYRMHIRTATQYFPLLFSSVVFPFFIVVSATLRAAWGRAENPRVERET